MSCELPTSEVHAVPFCRLGSNQLGYFRLSGAGAGPNESLSQQVSVNVRMNGQSINFRFWFRTCNEIHEIGANTTVDDAADINENLAEGFTSQIFCAGKKDYGPYDQFKMRRVRLNQLGLLSLTLGCSTFWQNWQHKQTISSSLSLNFLRLINPDNPYETPFKEPDLLAFSGLLSLTFISHSS